RSATRLGDETRRRSVFGFRAIQKSASRRRKILNGSELAAKFFRPTGSSAPVLRDRHKAPRQFPRSENRAPFARPGPVLQKRDRAQVCRESAVRLLSIDQAGNANRARSISPAGLRRRCE